MDTFSRQLFNVPPASNGSSDQFKIPWATFVNMVIDVTTQAYLCLRRDKVAKREWQEDVFSIHLGDYLRDISFDYGIRVVVRSKVHTERIRSGIDKSNMAKEMDIWLNNVWERKYDEIGFVWEAKLLVDRRLSEDRKGLISEYISQGMLRFIDEEYASEVVDSGMLGYILDGKVEDIVAQINQSMSEPQRERKLKSSEHLQLRDAVGEFQDVFLSEHTRIQSQKIIRSLLKNDILLPTDEEGGSDGSDR